MKKVRITESQLRGLVKRMIKEERDSTVMLSLGRKVYQDLKNKGFKVHLDQDRTASNMQAYNRKYTIGNKEPYYSYDSADFFITSSYFYVEIQQNRKQYQSNSSITEMNNALKELKQKYENEDISASILENKSGITYSKYPQLIFTLNKKGNY